MSAVPATGSFALLKHVAFNRRMLLIVRVVVVSSLNLRGSRQLIALHSPDVNFVSKNQKLFKIKLINASFFNVNLCKYVYACINF